jgi:hypothetical protein
MSEEMIPVSWIDDQVIVHRKRANDSNIQYRKKVENLKANTIEDLIAKWKGIKEDKKPFQIGTQIIANTDPSMVRICTSIDVKVPPPIIGTFTGNTCTIAGEEHIEVNLPSQMLTHYGRGFRDACGILRLSPLEVRESYLR